MLSRLIEAGRPMGRPYVIIRIWIYPRAHLPLFWQDEYSLKGVETRDN